MSATLTIKGRLTSDPELRYTKNDTAVCTLNIAVNKAVRDKNDKWTSELDAYYQATFWREQAEEISQALAKGDPVIVTGKPEINVFTRKNGDTDAQISIQGKELSLDCRYGLPARFDDEGDDRGSSRGRGNRNSGKNEGGNNRASSRGRNSRNDDDIPF